MSVSLAITNAQIIDPSRGLDAIGSLLVEDGKIVGSGPEALNQGIPEGFRHIDGKGKTVLPGLVDTRVYVGEPGQEHRETIETASQAAAAGGVTSFVMMPDTEPAIDSVALVEFVKKTARDNALVNVYPCAALTRGLKEKEMTNIGLLMQAGAVAFSSGPSSLTSNLVMQRSLAYLRDFNGLMSVDVQDRALSNVGVASESLYADWLGLPTQSPDAELIALDRDLRLARTAGTRYHAAQISTAEAAKTIGEVKAVASNIHAGVCINHLSLNCNDIGAYRSFFRMEPPLREEQDRLALIDALKDGRIDTICSNHMPQDVEAKRLPFAESEPGAIGLETLFAAALRLHHSGAVPLLRLVEALATSPARIFGLDAGTLAPGMPADFVIADLNMPWIVKENQMRSRSKNTCFDGALMQGRVLQTFVAGRNVFQLEDGETN